MLIEPPVSPFDVPTKVFAMPPPYHLEISAGRLVRNHDVRTLDMRIDENLNAEFEAFRPDVVGCSCVAANSHLAKQVLKKAKEFCPDTVTVIGGHHRSLMPEDCNHPFVDAVVIGEGEETLHDLVAACESRRSWDENPGIPYRFEDNGFRVTFPPAKPGA